MGENCSAVKMCNFVYAVCCVFGFDLLETVMWVTSVGSDSKGSDRCQRKFNFQHPYKKPKD